MVVLKFIIGKTGKAEDISIIKPSKNELLDAAAVDFPKEMNDQPNFWAAGSKDGKAVRTTLNLPVKFKLN